MRYAVPLGLAWYRPASGAIWLCVGQRGTRVKHTRSALGKQTRRLRKCMTGFAGGSVVYDGSFSGHADAVRQHVLKKDVQYCPAGGAMRFLDNDRIPPVIDTRYAVSSKSGVHLDECPDSPLVMQKKKVSHAVAGDSGFHRVKRAV